MRSIEPENSAKAEDRTLLSIANRIIIERGHIVVELSETTTAAGSSTLRIPWSPKPGKSKREIVLPHGDPTRDQLPIRVERRETLLRSVGKGRVWLKELLAGKVANTAAIAERERRSNRSVQMTIALAFVAPDIIEAAVRGALPRGIGLTRLMDLPPLWSDQRQALGLKV